MKVRHTGFTTFAAIVATVSFTHTVLAQDDGIKAYIDEQLEKYQSYERAETLTPGSITLRTPEQIKSVRSLFRWEVDVENVLGRHGDLPTFIQFEPLSQAGVPAYKIEWYGFGENGATDDITFVRQDNFQRLWRVLAAGGGRFNTIHDVIAGQTTTLDLSFDGAEPRTEVKTYPLSDAFDLAALPFALAFKERSPGTLRKVAIKNSSRETGYELADLAEIGPDRFTDAKGRSHAAYRFDFIRKNGEHWDYYVSYEPPYWFGLLADFQDGHKTHIFMQDFELLQVNVDKEYLEFVGEPATGK